MNRARPRIRERLPGDRNELPIVAVAVQGELQHAMRGTVTNLAGGPNRAEARDRYTSSANDELTDAVPGVRRTVGLGLRQATAVVPVAAQDAVDTSLVERLPPRVQESVRVVRRTRTESRFVPGRDDVVRRARSEIRAQPRFLSGSDGVHLGPRDLSVTRVAPRTAVEHNDARRQCRSWVATAAIAGRTILIAHAVEVVEIRSAPAGDIDFRSPSRSRFVPAPRLFITGSNCCAVPSSMRCRRREDSTGNRIEQCRRRFRTGDAQAGRIVGNEMPAPTNTGSLTVMVVSSAMLPRRRLHSGEEHKNRRPRTWPPSRRRLIGESHGRGPQARPRHGQRRGQSVGIRRGARQRRGARERDVRSDPAFTTERDCACGIALASVDGPRGVAEGRA